MKSSGKRLLESGRNIGAETFPACRAGSKKGESVCLRGLPASRTARSPGRAEGGSGGESGGAASPYEVVQKKLGERRRDMEGSGRIRKDAKESAQQGTARHVLRGAAELRRSSGGACRHCALRKLGARERRSIFYGI